VEYSLLLAEPPDLWRWQFQIGEKARAGRTKTKISFLAVRRVQLNIDRELKALAFPARLERQVEPDQVGSIRPMPVNGPRYRASWRIGYRVARKDSADKAP
jgi:hypothetical protein